MDVPLALFDTLKLIDEPVAYDYLDDVYCLDDIEQGKQFLKLYIGSQGTFNSYRREIERLIHWAALAEKKSLSQLNRHDIENFITFCSKPHKSWIGTTKPPRFLNKEGVRVPNVKWRPFVVTVSKAKHQAGELPEIKQFELASSSIREIFCHSRQLFFFFNSRRIRVK